MSDFSPRDFKRKQNPLKCFVCVFVVIAWSVLPSFTQMVTVLMEAQVLCVRQIKTTDITSLWRQLIGASANFLPLPHLCIVLKLELSFVLSTFWRHWYNKWKKTLLHLVKFWCEVKCNIQYLMLPTYQGQLRKNDFAVLKDKTCIITKQVHLSTSLSTILLFMFCLCCCNLFPYPICSMFAHLFSYFLAYMFHSPVWMCYCSLTTVIHWK